MLPYFHNLPQDWISIGYLFFTTIVFSVIWCFLLEINTPPEVVITINIIVFIFTTNVFSVIWCFLREINTPS